MYMLNSLFIFTTTQIVHPNHEVALVNSSMSEKRYINIIKTLSSVTSGCAEV